MLNTGFLIGAGQLIFALSILVFVHELGHFLAARAFGIKVEKFFIFFDVYGTKLWSKKIGETEYGIGTLPLGGYVKIAGMIDESMDKEQLKLPPQSWEFRSKPAWQRLIVMIAGVIMNIIVGIIILAFCNLYFIKGYVPADALKDGVYAFEMGERLGFKTGDKILKVNGETPNRLNDIASGKLLFGADIEALRDGKTIKFRTPDTLFKVAKGMPTLEAYKHDIKIGGVAETNKIAFEKLKEDDVIAGINGANILNYGQLKDSLLASKNKVVSLDIKRANERLKVEVPVDTAGKIGFMPIYDSESANEFKKYGLGSAFVYGCKDGFAQLYYSVLGIGKMISGKISFVKDTQSLVGIGRIYGAEWIWEKFWLLTALISLGLAVMNMLPIPALDGGHIMFLIAEMIKGKPLSESFQEKAQMVGMIILIPLMIFMLLKDVVLWWLEKG